MNPAMLQHNPNLHASALSQGLPPNFAPPTPTSHDAAAFFNSLDASSSKQLAALNAAGNARRSQAAAISGGSSASLFGGIPPSQHALRTDNSYSSIHQPVLGATPQMVPPFNLLPQHTNPGMAQPQRQQMTPQQVASFYKQRQVSFLQGLAKVMIARGMPLPASITGVDVPYDQTTSPWKTLEPSSEPGGVRLAGRDIDLFKLWSIVLTAGGAAKVQQLNMWPNIVHHFGLPEQLPRPQENGNSSTILALSHLYMMLLAPFEEMYHNRDLPDSQKQSLMQQARVPNVMSSYRQSMGALGASGSAVPTQTATTAEIAGAPSLSADSADLDPDGEVRKRKLDEVEEMNGKRARRKAGSESPTISRGVSEAVSNSHMPTPPVSHGRAKSLRRKIEYVPFARQVETAGGRDITHIQNELTRLSRGFPLRDINEWGKVYVDNLVMSLRSRMSTELSYGLTTLALLSTMRSAASDTGFLISQCEELLDELLDLLEELAFPGESNGDMCLDNEIEIITNRKLVNLAHDENTSTFAAEQKRGDHDPTIPGSVQRRADLIRLMLNILRNLSVVKDNQEFMGRHPVLVDLLLRITSLHAPKEQIPRPSSSAFSLPDLIAVRKDVLNTLVNLACVISLASPDGSSINTTLRSRCLFNLVASYIVDPVDAVNPVAWLMQSGAAIAPQPRAPLLLDAALEVFSRISQPDANRKFISTTVPQERIWALFEALLRRLPSEDTDYKLVLREESWMSYLEKLILSLYSLAFLMPPEMKRRVKEDRGLSFAKVMLRFVKRIMSGGPAQAELRAYFVLCARRSVETLKVIDDGADPFDVAQPSLPPLAFGVGYGEVGDQKVEKGLGLLGGHREDVLWQVMLQRELDDVMFAELESLSRVEFDCGVN